MGSVTIGVDIGQRRDPTAIAVVEVDERKAVTEEFQDIGGGNRLRTEKVRVEEHYVVRYLERLELGTSYPQIAARVAEVAAGVCARTRCRPELFLDATGVGTPVVDVLRDARVQADLYPVYFTHGDRRTVHSYAEISLGKAHLVSRLQALLQTERLHLPRTAEAEALAQELLVYEIRVSENANDTYGAFKVGTHDDLVTALGLAVQEPVRAEIRILA